MQICGGRGHLGGKWWAAGESPKRLCKLWFNTSLNPLPGCQDARMPGCQGEKLELRKFEFEYEFHIQMSFQRLCVAPNGE